MQPAPATPSAQSAKPTPEDTAAEIRRLQSRLAELQTAQHGIALDPVTFQAFGAGAHTAPDNPDVVLFAFPVHHAKVVRIAAEHATACQFAQSLVETLGGWDAVRGRGQRRTIQQLKRGCRR